MSETKPSLDAAYALETPEDNRKLYADWAETYDASFAAEKDYLLPQIVAGRLSEIYDGSGPVLDVGAGTGLIAQFLDGQHTIDALDISPEMLAVAAEKGLYRDAIQGDLTARLPIGDAVYGAVVSSGTFTHGHVGPDALDELLRVARPGAQFVLSINATHFEARGFAAKFAALEPHISHLTHQLADIYGPGADEAHKQDQAQITTFLKR